MLHQDHITRLRVGLTRTQDSLRDFITTNTFLGLKPFSFRGHEYQRYILNLIESDPDINLMIYKSSQMGISELIHRVVLAKMALTAGHSTLMAMPSHKFAQEVVKTRISSIINTSSPLRELVDYKVDSASVKQFTNTSILYALGAGEKSGQSSLINRPINLVVVDELDRCSIRVVTGFRSRQTHSLYKPRVYISTPTYEDLGIDGESDGAEMHLNMVICNHCGHEFYPDFYKHVRVPGFNNPIETLTRRIAEQTTNISIDDSHLECPNPKCHKTPDLSPEHRRFRTIPQTGNPTQRKICVKISPFDGPSFISTPSLVRAKFTYRSDEEFRNQALGLPVKASKVSIRSEDIIFDQVEIPRDSITVVGLDFGKLSHALQLSVTPQGQMVCHSGRIIPLNSVLAELDLIMTSSDNPSPRPISGVVDSVPYTDMVNRIINKYKNIWSAVYHVPVQPQPELYKLKISTPDAPTTFDISGNQVRQITLNMQPFFDHTVNLVQSGQIIFQSSDMDREILRHLQDMRRVKDYRYVEERYKWVKSRKGDDHFFHALNFAVAATKVSGHGQRTALLPRTLLSTIKIKDKTKPERARVFA